MSQKGVEMERLESSRSESDEFRRVPSKQQSSGKVRSESNHGLSSVFTMQEAKFTIYDLL